MNASINKLHALRRRGLAKALVSFALLAVSAPATLGVGGTATQVACQANTCGG